MLSESATNNQRSCKVPTWPRWYHGTQRARWKSCWKNIVDESCKIVRRRPYSNSIHLMCSVSESRHSISSFATLEPSQKEPSGRGLNQSGHLAASLHKSIQTKTLSHGGSWPSACTDLTPLRTKMVEMMYRLGSRDLIITLQRVRVQIWNHGNWEAKSLDSSFRSGTFIRKYRKARELPDTFRWVVDSVEPWPLALLQFFIHRSRTFDWSGLLESNMIQVQGKTHNQSYTVYRHQCI